MRLPEVAHAAGRLTWVGGLLRWAARQVPDGAVVRIPCGGNAGLRWRHRRGYVSGYWTGTYEPEMQRALRRWLRPGQRMFDAGAHAGFFTLLAARLVGRGGRVVAFEPQKDLARACRESAELNRKDQVSVLEVALGRASGVGTLAAHGVASSMTRVVEGTADDSGERVQLWTMDEATDVMGYPIS